MRPSDGEPVGVPVARERRSPNRRGRRTIGQLWRDAPLPLKGLSVLVIPLIALLGTVVGSRYQSTQQSRFRTSALQVVAVRQELNETEVLLFNAETGVQGYVATHRPPSLQPYDRAVRQLPGDLRALHSHLAADSASRGALRSMSAQASQVLRELQQIRSQAVSGQLGRAALDAELVAETRSMNRLRSDVATLQAQQTRFLDQRRASSNRVAATVGLIDWAALGIGVLGGVIGTLLFSFGIVRRIDRLKVNAQRFVSDEPMLEVKGSRNEIGRLSGELDRAAQLLQQRDSELRAARDEAVAASRAKDDFLSRMSHELRTPLTAILGFGQLLQMEELSSRDAESVDHIVRAGHHLLGLINELLDIARIESGKMSLSVEPVVVADVVTETVALMAPTAAGQGITITVAGPAGLTVLADVQRLKQVLLNLLSNAVKYNRPDGSVSIAHGVDGDAGVITVTDTGFGIAPEQLDRLFVPFDRLDADRTSVQGSGVGLSLSRGLLEAMNGSVEVNSEPGKGSTFTVRLPRHVSALSGAVTPVGADQEQTTPVVLYVEDNLANLRVVERVFQSRSETLQVAIQGRMCLALAEELHPRLIVLDLNLPDMEGEAVLDQLLRNPRTADIPVVLLTAEVSSSRIQRLLDRGATAFLAKPVDIRTFGDILDAVSVGSPAAE